MLSPERAKQALKEFEVKDGAAARRAEAMALVGDARAAALGIIGLGPDGAEIKDLQRRTNNSEAAFAALTRLSEADRLAALTAIFGPLGEAFLAVWRMAPRLPYQMLRYSRHSFRAPGDATVANALMRRLIELTAHFSAGYRQDVVWWAQYASYAMPHYTDQLGLLFAAAIDNGGPTGDKVYDILTQTASGEHPIGAFGRHVSRGLMCASRPEGWTLMEGMLIAAQRQEGLRQVVLETVDECHPEAYRRMLRLIIDHDITRFSSCIRAIDTWFGFRYEAMDAKFAARSVQTLLGFIEDKPSRDAAWQGAEGEPLYMAMHADAMEDAVAVTRRAAAFTNDPNPGRRYVAARMLELVWLSGASEALVPFVSDPDLHVVAEALTGVLHSGELKRTDLFERIERLLPNLTEASIKLSPIVWPWNEIVINRERVASMLIAFLGTRPPARLLPHLPMMDSTGRAATAAQLASAVATEPSARETLFALTGDAAPSVRELAFAGLAKCKITQAEAIRIEDLLRRKASDVRRGALTMLLAQEDSAALASAKRLAESDKAEQRAAGAELLAQLNSAKRSADRAQSLAAELKPAFQKRGDDAALRAIEGVTAQVQLGVSAEKATFDDALGLMNPAGCSKPVPPRMPKKLLIFQGEKASATSDAGGECIRALDALVARNAEVEITISNRFQGDRKELLGNLTYGFRAAQLVTGSSSDLPLADTWRQWYESRPSDQRDPDGFELRRATFMLQAKGADAGNKPRYEAIVRDVLYWLLHVYPPAGEVDFLVDLLETACAKVPANVISKPPEKVQHAWQMMTGNWRFAGDVSNALNAVGIHFSRYGERWSPEQIRRFWGLRRWIDEPHPNQARYRPTIDQLIAAFEVGAATQDDVYDHLLGSRISSSVKMTMPGIDLGAIGLTSLNAAAISAFAALSSMQGQRSFDSLRQLSGRKMSGLAAKHPWLEKYVEACRGRILDLEIARGELPGEATNAVGSLMYAGSMPALLKLATALGKTDIDRNHASYSSSGQGRTETLSGLIRRTFPTDGETPELFASAVKQTGIPDKLLIQIAVFAPQWSSHIEAALGMPGLAEAVWWLHAHTKDQGWSIDQETRAAWTSETSRRTPLEASDLIEGAVDVAWFNRIHEQLTPAQWKALEDCAKFTTTGTGHTRAQLFARAMLGKVTEADLIARVESKRHQDSLRALGLVPFRQTPTGVAPREDVLRRYAVIQEFLRGSRKFGSMKQASEKLAVAIAMQNLARTAGYPDPIRLEWAMEREAVADLADGEVERTAADVTVTLAIDEWGAPDLRVTRAGKALKEIPAAAKKAPEIAELIARKSEIVKQHSRMRLSLEQAMCRGDAFFDVEIADLMVHPVLSPMLRSLVLIEESGEGEKAIMGYPVAAGTALESHDGRAMPIPPGSKFRVAHSHDLWQSGEWEKWQWDCFSHERVQPFKQVFRELYPLTPAERENGLISTRYAGHQINQKQALAILGKRGWVGNPQEDDLSRTFHAEGVTACISFDYGVTTPAEVEGLTIDSVRFAKRGKVGNEPLELVPPRFFSEAMRDLDLIVSVAHQGGVDPEASASTVEMRSALLRDACRLLKLDNVRLQTNHALIDGQLAKYSVHLGSGVVHRQPGGFVCIVPVHSQHRGRVFLPFADDDPRTAEVLSKVVLLAKDSEIKDPVILEQIYAGA
jgi:hypothetical protein